MPIRNGQEPEMLTSRYSVQGGHERGGIKCKLHPITIDIPLHLHDFYEIELIMSGRIEQTVNGVPLVTGAGDFVFMDLLSTQRLSAPQDAPSVWTLSISPAEVAPSLSQFLARAKFPIVGHLAPSELAHFHRLAEELVRTMESDSPYAAERATALTVLLSSLLLENGQALASPAEEPRAYHYIQQALFCLNEDFASPLTLGEVAGRIHISPCYLSDLFSRIVGCRFVEYLTHLRLERAQDMLTSGEGTVAAIAAACGFGTVSNFTRAYRRAFGVSPSAKRREIASADPPKKQ